MDSSDIFQSYLSIYSTLPQLLNNFHSSSSRSLLRYDINQRYIDDNYLFDIGGAAISLDYIEDSFKVYQFKIDSINGASFIPKCCSIPLIFCFPSSNPCKIFQSIVNNLVYDSYYDTLIRAVNKKKIILESINRNEIDEMHYPYAGKIKSYKAFTILDSKDGLILDILPTNKWDENNTIFTLQEKSCTLLKISKDEDEFSLLVDSKKKCSSLSEEDTKFLHFSRNNFLSGHIAFSISNDKDWKLLKNVLDYDQQNEKTFWKTDPSIGDSKIKMYACTGIEWSGNHPKLLYYGETTNFGFFDTRIEPNSAFRNIFQISESHQIASWERIRAFTQLRTNSHQNLLALDSKLILVDSRYAGKNIIQWEHMLQNNFNNRLRLIQSNILNEDETSIVILCNNTDICLISIEDKPRNFIQPISLHHPLHISKISDCWYFSNNTEDLIEARLKSCIISGIAMVHNNEGFSIFQSSNLGDLFVQEFIKRQKTFTEDQIEYSWKWKGCCNPFLENDYQAFLEEAFKDLMKKEPFEKDHLYFKPIECKCCKLPHDSKNDSDWSEDIDDQSQIYSLDNLMNGDMQLGTVKIMMRELFENVSQESLNTKWGEFTGQLLENWFEKSP